MIKPELSDADIAAFRSFFVLEDADPTAEVEMHIAFSPATGWRVQLEVFEASSHVTCEGEDAPTFDAAFKSACAKF